MPQQSPRGGTRVPIVTEPDASGRTAELYDMLKRLTGLPFVPDLFTLLGTKPELLQAMVSGFSTLSAEGTLPRPTKELIAAWTARLNQCTYCVGTHNHFLLQFGGSAELAAAISTATTVDELPVDERTTELLRLVTQVTTAAYRIGDPDWQRVADAGWSDDELLEAVFCAALFNFVVRVVDAFGLSSARQHSRISELSRDQP